MHDGVFVLLTMGLPFFCIRLNVSPEHSPQKHLSLAGPQIRPAIAMQMRYLFERPDASREQVLAYMEKATAASA